MLDAMHKVVCPAQGPKTAQSGMRRGVRRYLFGRPAFSENDNDPNPYLTI